MKSFQKFFIALLIFIIFAGFVSALDLPVGVQKVIENANQNAQSITILIAFIGGILAFLSPCGFVLLPSFFAVMFNEKKRAVYLTFAFTLGLLVTFSLMGVAAGFIGNLSSIVKNFLSEVGGLVFILFGIMIFFNKGFGFRIKQKPVNGFLGMFLLGAGFSFGWSPCVGPVIAGAFLLAAQSSSWLFGGVLLAAFGLGIGVPMLLLAAFIDKFNYSPKWLTGTELSFSLFGKKIFTTLYNVFAGIFLVVVGVVMFFYSGTGLFMEELGPYWSMDLAIKLNYGIIDVASQSWANIIGFVLVAIVIIAVVYFIFKQKKLTLQQP